MSQNTTIMSVQILIYVETLYVPLFIVKMVCKTHTVRFKQKLKELAGNYISYFMSHTNLSLRPIDFEHTVTVVPGIKNRDTIITGRGLEPRG